MQDLIEIVKSLEDSGILIDGITETGTIREGTIRAGYGSKKI